MKGEGIFLVEVVLQVINPLQIINVPETITARKDFEGNLILLKLLKASRPLSIKDNSFPAGEERRRNQCPPEPVFSDVDIRRPIFRSRPVYGLSDTPWTHLQSCVNTKLLKLDFRLPSDLLA